MKTPKLKIRYSKSCEIERISESIEKLDWYQKHNYYILLPRQVLKKQNISKKEIRSVLNIEYRESQYKKTERKIYNWWLANKEKITKSLNKRKVKILNHYVITLTRYGTGGSYNPPQEIIINISKKSLKRIYGTIVHEIIHLGIEDLIRRYNVPHFSKERLVDLLMETIAPRFSFKQNLPLNRDVKIIDKVWKEGIKEAPFIIKRFTKLKI